MIVVIGEILIDVFDDYQRIGGAPFNFAFHLKKLGWPVRLLTRVGDDAYGKTILDLLKKHKFNIDDVQIDTHHPTGTVRVALDGQGVPQFDIHTNVAYDYLDDDTADSTDWPSVQMIYIGTLAQRNSKNCTRIQSIMNHKHLKTKVFYDINLRPPHINTEAVETSLRHADIIKLNTDELTTIQNMFHGPENAKQCVPWLMNQFLVEMVVLTKGPEGSTIYTADQTVVAPSFKTNNIVDTVGAGDAYAAATAAGCLNGLPPDVIAEKASAFAAYICTLPGAVPEVSAIYKELRRQLGGTTHA
ncbi:MAG: PfkB family carbohydrate kinase [Desulfobacterales bacterium]|nr:PfkB family carbohydrate kinase [Desulfobacterales bacterium]